MKTIYVKEIAENFAKSAGGIKDKVKWKKVVPTAVFLGAMFLLGRAAAELYTGQQETSGRATESEFYEAADEALYGAGSALEQTGGVPGAVPGEEILYEAEGVILQKTENWGLGFSKKAGEKPTGTATTAEMKKYDAYYMAEGEEKVLYLTFDCGYENGNTEPILDALKKHNAPATFFVVGHFLESAPEIAKRMVEDGHTVGNHTYHHYDMSKISDKTTFAKEMDDVAKLFRDTTGSELASYYRPPQGKYSTENLQMAKDMGYTTFFWSLAYVDWNKDSQPSHKEAMEKLTARVHPGAVVLLHSTSKTNGEIMDELLTKWEEMGYTFRPLSDFQEKTDEGNLNRA